MRHGEIIWKGRAGDAWCFPVKAAERSREQTAKEYGDLSGRIAERVASELKLTPDEAGIVAMIAWQVLLDDLLKERRRDELRQRADL